MYRTLDRLAKMKGLGMTARRVLDCLPAIKSGDIVLSLVDGRELKLRRVSRPDPQQAEILTSDSTSQSASAPTPSTRPL